MPSLSFWDRFGAETVTRLALEPGMAVLDMCCGPSTDGSSALMMANSGEGCGGSVVMDGSAAAFGQTPHCRPADPFHAENVHGLPEVAGQRLILMGLDHLGGRSGRIFRAVPGAAGWTLFPVAVLDAEPRLWLGPAGA